MHTTQPPTTHRRRRARSLSGVLAAVAVSGLALVATAAPASATNEFPAKPTASATIECNDGAAAVTIELGNASGLSAANFAVSVTGLADQTSDIAAGSSGTIVHFGLAENTDVTVAITANDGFTYSKVFPINCFDFVGGIVQTCDGTQPVLTANVDAIGIYGDTVRLEVNGNIVDSSELYSGSSTTFTAQVPDEAPFTSELISLHDGTITDLSGTPHCTPEPTTTTTSTLPAPPTPTDPPQVLAQQADPPAPYVAPYVAPAAAPTELPRTGSSTLPLAIVGTTLLGLGIAARRFAARRV